MYVTNRGDNTLSVLDVGANVAVATVPVGSAPEGLAVSPNGATVYVANTLSNTMTVVDTASRSVRATVAMGNFPGHIAVAPGGSPIYVTNRTSGTIAVVDALRCRRRLHGPAWPAHEA